jgi:Zn ribbon nucleic-acid-binding protein
MSGYRVWGIWRCRACEAPREFITYDLNSIDADMAECCACGYQYGKTIDMSQEDPTKRVRATLSKKVINAGRKRYMAEQKYLARGHGMLSIDLMTPQIIKELERRETGE